MKSPEVAIALSVGPSFKSGVGPGEIKFDLGPKPHLAGGSSLRGENMTKPAIKFTNGTIRFAALEQDSLAGYSGSDGISEVQSILAENGKKSKPSEVLVPEVFQRSLESISRPATLEYSERRILPMALLWLKTAGIFSSPVVQGEVYSNPQTTLSTQAEVRIKDNQSTHFQTQLPSEAPHSEEVEIEEEVVTIKKQHQEQEITNEEQSKRRIIVVHDKVVSERRVDRVKRAFKMVLISLGFRQKVAGRDISKALDPSDSTLLSGLVQPFGPDGSLEDAIKDLNSREFDSADQAVDAVKKHIPVKDGTPDEEHATEEEKNKVTRHSWFKPPLVREIIERRWVRKTKQVPVFGFGDSVKPKLEFSLEDQPELAKVFQG